MRNRLYYLRFIRTVVAEGDGGGSGAGQGDPDPTPEPKTDPKTDEQLGEAGLKALKAEREANKAAKASIAELQAKIKTFEDKDKTDEEKQSEHVKELEKTSSANALKVLQYEVAAEKGIPLKMATRLRGDDKDSMLKDADELLPLLQHEPNNPRTPKPDKSAGHGGGPKPATLQQAIAGHLK